MCYECRGILDTCKRLIEVDTLHRSAQRWGRRHIRIIQLIEASENEFYARIDAGHPSGSLDTEKAELSISPRALYAVVRLLFLIEARGFSSPDRVDEFLRARDNRVAEYASVPDLVVGLPAAHRIPRSRIGNKSRLLARKATGSLGGARFNIETIGKLLIGQLSDVHTASAIHVLRKKGWLTFAKGPADSHLVVPKRELIELFGQYIEGMEHALTETKIDA